VMVVATLARIGLVLAVALAAACGGGEEAPERAAAPPTEEATTTVATTTTTETPATTAEQPPAPQPAIVVETPKAGEELSSPVEVAGTADVFEANVTVRLLDKTGDEISRGFTTATCGTGCRGDFSTQVVFRIRAEQRGTVVVSDDDADGDGKPQHQVRIPVVLVPQ
jgi:hypothetical protein